jgi:hypothetical protein
MKRFKSALTVLLVLSCISALDTRVVKADSDDYIQSSAYKLYSPLNRTYNSRFLTLNMTFGAAIGIKYSLSYEIDGKDGNPIPFVIDKPNETHVVYKAIGFAKLPELSEGPHKLTIHFIASGYQPNGLSYVDTLYFTINTQSQKNTIPEFSSWMIIPLFLAAPSVILIFRRSLKKAV